jgi:hypothetical protein
MSESKMNLVFVFNSVELTDETVLSAPVDPGIPHKGGAMRRRGRVWTVIEVQRSDAPSGNSVYRIFLSEQRKRNT